MKRFEHRGKVMLVDDEPNILIALEFLLEKEGYHVMSFGNGHDVLAYLQDNEADIVVLDVMMPGMSGFEVASEIRKLPHCDEVRIVFLTARGTQADKKLGYISGGEVYMTKPFDNEELVRVINEVVEFG